MKRTSLVLIVAALALMGFGVFTSVHGQAAKAASAGTNAPDARTIGIDNFSFSPASITVPVGTTLTWTNRDDIPHTVVSNDQRFKSKALDTDERFSFTFTEPGTYSYFCSIHPKMTAKVIVEEKK